MYTVKHIVNGMIDIGKTIGDNVILYTHNDFILVTDINKKKKDMTPTIEEQLKLARSYVNEKVFSERGSFFTVESVAVLFKGAIPEEFNSRAVSEKLQNNDSCVVVRGSGYTVPVEEVTLVERFKRVQLNSEYSAKVYKDKIVLGCQTFDFSVINDIVEARNQL